MLKPCVTRADGYRDPSVQMQNLLSLLLNIHRAKPMKETQKRAETFNRGFIYNGGKGGTHKEQNYPTIRNAVNVQAKALIQLLLKDGHAHAHTYAPRWSLWKASSSRTGARDQSLCLDLSTLCGLAEPIRWDLNAQLDAAANTG